MRYQVKLKPRAEKELNKLPEIVRWRILEALKGLVANPYVGKKLDGEHAGEYSLRVWPYRIIYQVHKHELMVLVIRVGHRQGVY